MPTPDTLYKVVTKEQFLHSQGKEFLELGEADREFIHFSTEEQYPRIMQKFSEREPTAPYVLLEIKTKELMGDMRFEPNPGKSEKYFHLYNGSIPMSSLSLIHSSEETEYSRPTFS